MGEDEGRAEAHELRQQIAELQRRLAAVEQSDASSLTERELLLREAERVVHVGTWTWDFRTGAVTWSDELFRIFGLEPAEIQPSAEAFTERVHPDDRAQLRATSERGVVSGKFPRLDFRVVRPNGDVRSATLSGSCLFDTEGRPRCMVGAILDRTERLETEAELRRTLALLEEAQRSAQLGSWRFDPETGDTEWSAEFRRIAGIGAEERPSVPAFLQRVVPEDQRRFGARHQEILFEPRGGEIQGRISRPDGEVRHVRIKGALVQRDDGRPELRGTMLDITDQVHLREELAQAQKMDAVGRLAAGIAHDFNNLLTIVTGNLELLSSRMEGSPELEDSLRAVESASNLTRRLLAFGRRAHLSLARVEPNDLVQSTMSLMRRLVGDQIKLETDLAPNLPSVRVDALEIERALVNLVVNSRDAMPNGGVVRIATSQRSQDGMMWVEIVVADDGPGIGEHDLQHIFEPFYTTRPASGGTGLGLATVLGTAEQHGGTVRVSSTLGGGAVFTMVLPAAEGDEAPESRATSETRLVVRDRPALRILVIDDEAMVAQATCRMLASKGHRVHVATCLDEVRSIWALHGPDIDVIVCDVVMPDLRGPDMVAGLRRHTPDQDGAPPVLFISGYNEEAADVLAGRPVLAKPFSLAALEGAIERVLGAETSLVPLKASNDPRLR